MRHFSKSLVRSILEGQDPETVLDSQGILLDEDILELVEASSLSLGNLIRLMKTYLHAPPEKKKAITQQAGKALASLSPGSAIRSFGGSKEASGDTILAWADDFSELSQEAQDYITRVSGHPGGARRTGASEGVVREAMVWLQAIADSDYGAWAADAKSTLRAIKQAG